MSEARWAYIAGCHRGEVERLRDVLIEIAKGEGAFSEDPLMHATSTIANMKQLAEEALDQCVHDLITADWTQEEADHGLPTGK